MKRIICCVICFVLILPVCGCESTKKYMDQIDTISQIQIVELTNFNQEKRCFEETILTDIVDIPGFINDLCNIDYAQHFTDPVQLRAGLTVIKIVYSNGDYEHVYCDAQYVHRSDGGSYGYIEYDREQFEQLIEKYLNSDIGGSKS